MNERITKYVDNLFSNYKETEQLVELKEEIKANLSIGFLVSWKFSWLIFIFTIGFQVLLDTYFSKKNNEKTGIITLNKFLILIMPLIILSGFLYFSQFFA